MPLFSSSVLLLIRETNRAQRSQIEKLNSTAADEHAQLVEHTLTDHKQMTLKNVLIRHATVTLPPEDLSHLIK